MNDLQKELYQAFGMVSAIPVSGDAVEIMSAARERLRKAYKMAGNKQDLWAAQKQAERESQKKEADKHGG